jgi:hypothetical protein
VVLATSSSGVITNPMPSRIEHRTREGDHTLAMPTEFVAQNGAEIHESTPVSVTGCAKAKPAKKHKKKAKGNTKGKK